MSCVYCTGNTCCNPASNTRHLQHVFVQKHEDTTTNDPKCPKHVSICFQSPLEWGIAINHIFEPCEVPGEKAVSNWGAKHGEEAPIIAQPRRLRQMLKVVLLWALHTCGYLPCICFARSGFAPWGAVVYVVLRKNAETRTALVYKRLVLRLQRLHLSQEVVGTTCLTWIFHLCWRY